MLLPGCSGKKALPRFWGCAAQPRYLSHVSEGLKVSAIALAVSEMQNESQSERQTLPRVCTTRLSDLHASTVMKVTIASFSHAM